jgi:anti-anti-sigma factor
VSGLSIDARRDGGTAIVTLKGEARLEEIQRLYDTARAMKKEGAKRLLLGLQGLDFVDSASIGAFIELEKEFKAAGGSVVLFAAGRRLVRTIEDMGLKGRFTVVADEAAATATPIPS